jgi:uncharacterized membrane protein
MWAVVIVVVLLICALLAIGIARLFPNLGPGFFNAIGLLVVCLLGLAVWWWRGRVDAVSRRLNHKFVRAAKSQQAFLHRVLWPRHPETWYHVTLLVSLVLLLVLGLRSIGPSQRR